jgi:UDP-glucuronate decarboxylase
MIELAQSILKMTGSRSKIVHRPLPEDDPKQRRPDISEAQRLLNWYPTVSLEPGLKATIEYFEKLLADREVARAL